MVCDVTLHSTSQTSYRTSYSIQTCGLALLNLGMHDGLIYPASIQMKMRATYECARLNSTCGAASPEVISGRMITHNCYWRAYSERPAEISEGGERAVVMFSFSSALGRNDSRMCAALTARPEQMQNNTCLSNCIQSSLKLC